MNLIVPRTTAQQVRYQLTSAWYREEKRKVLEELLLRDEPEFIEELTNPCRLSHTFPRILWDLVAAGAVEMTFPKGDRRYALYAIPESLKSEVNRILRTTPIKRNPQPKPRKPKRPPEIERSLHQGFR
jgi:hypothetical protein